MKRPELDYQILPIWIYGWLVVFALILLLSLVAPDSDAMTIVKLGGIVLCLFYVAKTFPRDYWLLGAMLATCIADIFLANNNVSDYGVFVFLVAQLLHLARLDDGRHRRKALTYGSIAMILIGLNTISLIMGLPIGIRPALHLTCILYAGTILMNIGAAYKWYRREPHNSQAVMALAGFVLFACCDSGTVVSYASLMGILPAYFYAPTNFMVWVFYYPSQVLIANTGKLLQNPKKCATMEKRR